jgi:flagellar biosynthetic protein FliP
MTGGVLRLLLALPQPEQALSLTVGGGGSAPVKIFLLLTALSFAGALLVSVTCFTRVVVVLSFLRQALGTPQLPPNQVLIGLALVLSAFVMAPTASRVHQEALGPYLEDRMGHAEALQRAAVPLREFMLRQTRQQDLQLFLDLAAQSSPGGPARPERGQELPMTVVVPAFMVSELTTAFRMGLFLYVPLLIIDLLVASVLMSLGMMMVPPMMISLPLKVGVFVMADGWRLVVASIARSFS